MIALLLAAASAHVCRAPAVAYYGDNLARDMTAAELAQMERFAYCICGPDGSVDWDPGPDKRGRYRMRPSCDRNGWDGHSYRKMEK